MKQANRLLIDFEPKMVNAQPGIRPARWVLPDQFQPNHKRARRSSFKRWP